MSPRKDFFWAIRSASRSRNVSRQKTIKDDFSPNWVVLGLYCSYNKFHIFKSYTFLYFLHQNARFTSKALNQFFPNIFGQKLNKSFKKSTFMFFCRNMFLDLEAKRMARKKILSGGTFETGGFNICSTSKNVNTPFRV